MYVHAGMYIILKEDITKLLQDNKINSISVTEDEFLSQVSKTLFGERMPLPAIKQAIKEVKTSNENIRK